MDIFFQALVSYLVIVDPIGVSLIFNGLTSGYNESERRNIACRAVTISTLLVGLFGFGGSWLLAQLGIALESFRIAGGLLLFYTAFSMVVGTGQQERDDSATDKDISVYPLSIPLLAGPGCLTLTVLLFSGNHSFVSHYLPLYGAIITVYGCSLVGLFYARKVTKFMGETGNSIMKRLLGVLLAAMSIQFIADGIRGFIS
ncbi:MAG: MarC family protein [Desulfobulbaceae bacterium]|nr:MAG: MarC family protein [Desulfobulbaceae bacterium]